LNDHGVFPSPTVANPALLKCANPLKVLHAAHPLRQSRHPEGMSEQALREHVLFLLKGGGAHATFDAVVKDFPADLCGKKPRSLPYSAWQLLEHIRLTQADILNFCTNREYHELSWPDDYWPKSVSPEDKPAKSVQAHAGLESVWDSSILGYRRDLAKIEELVRSRDLFEKIPWGSGQTYLREALLVADHTAYHLGEIVTVRRLLGAWG
jgi:hypothetical protein